MAPPVMRLPLVLLATAATIIASQAVISGAYSLSGQAMQLGLLPRLEIRQTSATQPGQILHRRNVLVTVRTTDQPRVTEASRSTLEALNAAFLRIVLYFGYMERSDVPLALAQLSGEGVSLNPADTSYFLGRRTIVPGDHRGLHRLRDLLFIALARNSSDPSQVFAISAGRVVEMGTQFAV